VDEGADTPVHEARHVHRPGHRKPGGTIHAPQRRGEIILQPPRKNNGDTMPHHIPIIPINPDKRIRRQDINRYRYNPAWKGGQKGTLRPRIYKAMYVSGTFAVTDIQRLVSNNGDTLPQGVPIIHVPNIRSWIDKIVRRLRRSGHLAVVGRRPCAHGAGAEALYHVADRDKFRLEVMR
jgi:hypothetical protein